MKISLFGKTKNQQLEALTFIALSIFVMVVLILRAIKVPVSHDEATTFFNYVQSADFIPFLSKPDANNHPLNSFITYIFFHLFGSSPLSLRLSNLVFAPLYFFFCYKLSQELSSGILKWIFLPVMLFTFHVMEFFALTRGYGLSLTFLTAAIWQVFLAARTGQYKNYLYCNIFMFLSSLSILIELYNFTLLFVWSLAVILLNPLPGKFKEFIKVFISGAIPIAFLILYTLFLKKEGAYIERGYHGLWDASLKTLFMSITDLDWFKVQKLLLALTGLLILPMLLVLIISIVKKKWQLHPNLLFPYLLGGNLIIIVLVVKFFFSDYPESRLVLFLFPILVGSIVFTIDSLIMLTTKKILAIIAIPLLFFPVQSFQAMNFEYITWYKYCHIPVRFYDTVMIAHKSGEVPPLISGHGIHAWAWQFLVRQSGGVANEMNTLDFPTQKTKYKIIDLYYFKDWQQFYDTIDYDRVSNLHLLKKKGNEHKSLLYESKYSGSTERTNSENLMILERDMKEFRDKNIQLDIDLSLTSFDKLLYGSIAIVLYDSSNKDIMYDEIHLNWIREHWNGKPHNFIKSCLLHDLSKNADYVKIFLWNKGKSDFAINEGRIIFSELKETQPQ